MMNTKTSINEPIRILHMIGSFEVGGSQALVINLYKAIDRSKIQFDFIVDHPDRMELAPVVQELGARIFFMPTFVGGNILQVKKAWNTFFKEHPEYKILHSHVRSYASIYLPIAKKYGLKTIIHSHSTSNGRGITSVIKRIMQYPLRYQADFFMACSKEAGEWLFGKRVCQQANYSVINNAIDADKFVFSAKERERTRKELNIEDEFVVGFLARTTEAKNPLFILDVFEKVLLHVPSAKLLFVGDGELLKEVQRKAALNQVSDSVIFTGARSDVNNMFFAMDVYLLPSKWEGLGISLVEAQATGLKCVCSENIPDHAIVTDCVTRLFLNDGAECWAKHICAPQYRQYVRENKLMDIYQSGFHIGEISQKLENFYTEIYSL